MFPFVTKKTVYSYIEKVTKTFKTKKGLPFTQRQDKEKTEITFPPNWNEVKETLSSAEIAIYEQHNDAKTKLYRIHLAKRYREIFQISLISENELKIWQTTWLLLRFFQLDYLLSLSLYPTPFMNNGQIARSILTKELKALPSNQKEFFLDKKNKLITPKAFNIDKMEQRIKNFVLPAMHDLFLLSSIGEGGTDLSRLKLLNQISEEEDLDLIENYG